MPRTALIFFFATALAAAGAGAGTVADLDRKNGFRDVRFGMTSAQIPNLVLAERDGEDTYYTRTTDSKEIGGARVDTIAYGFHRDRLWAVVIKASGSSDSAALLRALNATYGEGHQPNQFIEEYLWHGSKVNMSYKQNMITKGAQVLIFSQDLHSWMMENQESEAANAADDL